MHKAFIKLMQLHSFIATTLYHPVLEQWMSVSKSSLREYKHKLQCAFGAGKPFPKRGKIYWFYGKIAAHPQFVWNNGPFWPNKNWICTGLDPFLNRNVGENCAVSGPGGGLCKENASFCDGRGKNWIRKSQQRKTSKGIGLNWKGIENKKILC